MAYALLRTLQGFEDSVNCLQFSPNGEWLAAGGDDGRLAIFPVACEDTADVSLVAPVPVTSLLWHPTEAGSIFVGYSNGDIFLYHLEMQQWFPSGSRIDVGLEGPVEALEYDVRGDALAAIVGTEVLLCKLSHKSNGRYVLRKWPHPTKLDVADAREVSPCAIHYIDDGQAIIVAYLHHGLICWDIESTEVKWVLPLATRIARSAISPDRKSIVVCNLQSGFDRYRIDHCELVQSYSIPPGENVALPALFIQNGDALVLGSACGTVVIVDKDDGSHIQTLDHPGDDIIQAIAYVPDADSRHIIATGTSERGRNTTIRLWAMDSDRSAGGSASPPSSPELGLDVDVAHHRTEPSGSQFSDSSTDSLPAGTPTVEVKIGEVHGRTHDTENIVANHGHQSHPASTQASYRWWTVITVAVVGVAVALFLDVDGVQPSIASLDSPSRSS